MSEVLKTDVAIIGAGPVGLFAVFQCGMLGLKAHVIDSLDQIGGQCTALYPEKPIYDIPAEPAIQAGQLIEQLEQQAAPFKPAYHLGQQVTGITGQAGDFTLTTSKGTTIIAKAIIIAAGAGHLARTARHSAISMNLKGHPFFMPSVTVTNLKAKEL